MRRVRYFVVDVFSKRPLAGNPLAVFPDRSLLRENELQRVARELNLSETVFVEPSGEEGALRRLRIFTPAAELPLAGHPVIGTWHLLAERGIVDFDEALREGLVESEAADGGGEKLRFRHELKAGVLPMTIYRDGGAVSAVAMDQAPPEFGEEVRDLGLAAEAVGVDEADIESTGLLPQAVSTGMFILMLPLATRDALSGVRLDLAAVERLCGEAGCGGIYAHTREAEEEWAFVRARGFFPGFGVPEDPATGSAAGCLGAYLARHRVLDARGTVAFHIEQGYEIGRPSRIGVEVTEENDEVTRVRIVGSAVVVAEAEMLLPD